MPQPPSSSFHRSRRILIAIPGCGGSTGTEASPNSSAGPTHPLVGSPGPDFTQKTVRDGKAVSLHALRGKVAIVDFWATWCEPCKKSFPKSSTPNARRTGSRSSASRRTTTRRVSRRSPMGSGRSSRSRGMMARPSPRSGGREGVPTTFVVDRQGVVRFVELRVEDEERKDREGRRTALSARVSSLFGAPSHHGAVALRQMPRCQRVPTGLPEMRRKSVALARDRLRSIAEPTEMYRASARLGARYASCLLRST